MKRASGAGWRPERAWGLARALLLLCLALPLAAFGQPAGAVHFTEARMLREAGGSFGPPPAQVPAQGPDGPWRDVSLPDASLAREPAPTGKAEAAMADLVTTWWRIDLPAFANAAPADVHLYLPRWQTIGQLAIYGDGQLLFQSRGGPVWNGFNRPVWVALAPTAGATLPRTVLVRMSSARSAGGAISSIRVGPQDEIAWRWRVRDAVQAQIPFMASAAFLAAGLFSLGVWAARRRETIWGLFFAASLMFFVRTLHFYWGEQTIPVPEDWFGWATVNSIGWFMITVYFFGFRLHGRTYPWVEWPMIALVTAATVIMLPPLKAVPLAAMLAPLAYLCLLAAGAVIVGTAVWSAWRARAGDALALALWNLLTLPAAGHDLMMQSYRASMESIYLTPLTGMGIFFLFLVIVARRYIRAIGEVEGANATLELRLREREEQLAGSYVKLREFEHRQTLLQERQRLMQDMHDGLGSSLMSALRMVERGRVDEADVAQTLRECIDDLKLTIDSLAPASTDLLLLLATLRYRLEPRLEGTGLALRWQVADVPALPWLDPRSALHVLRILQEALTNVIKHAQAGEVAVSTAADGDGVLVRVADNGRGMNGDREGMGLGNLRRRAQAIGARVQWRDAGPGTSFELWLPLQAPQATAP